MADFNIWGRIEKCGPRKFRAIASAMPDEPGAGPGVFDIRVKAASSLEASRETLGSLVHTVGAIVVARGDRIAGIDVR